MRSTLSVAPTQLRKILAELVDKGFLRFVEAQQLYITTHKGHLFLHTHTKIGYSKKILYKYNIKNGLLIEKQNTMNVNLLKSK